MSKHTPEPWYNDSPYRVHGATSDPDKRNGHCIFDYKHNSDDPNPDDYGRLVDCVNALAGIEKPEEQVAKWKALEKWAEAARAELAFWRRVGQVPLDDVGQYCDLIAATDAAGGVG